MPALTANFNIEPVELEAIDTDDRTLAISPPWSDLSRLRESIERIGLQTAVLVTPAEGAKLRIVSGFLRIQAALQLGLERVACRRLQPAPLADLFSIQLWDTLGSRQLNEIEKARVVERLTELCEMSDEEIVSDYLARLGGRPDYRQLRRYRQIDSLSDDLKRATGAGLSIDAALLLADWRQEERRLVVDIVGACRPGGNRQKLLIELLRDLRKRDQADAVSLWSDIGGAASDQLAGQPSLLDDAVDRLRDLRYPRLSAHQRRLKRLREQLQLPPNARLELPPFFEGDCVTARIEATDPDELRSAARRLAEAGQPLEEVFDLL